MKVQELFINGKKLKLEGKTRAQLEHLRQLAQDQVVHAQRAVKNYPPDRMIKYGTPYVERMEKVVTAIDAALLKV